MSLSSFWSIDGHHELLEGYPTSQEHWSLGDEVDEPRRALLDKIELALSPKIVSTEVRASERNLVLEVELEDGRREIVRAPIGAREILLFESEVALIEWLSQRTTIPVPRIRCVVRPDTAELRSFAVMEKLQGECLMNVFGGLSFADKESIIQEIANFMLQLNELAVPQQIGTTAIRNDVVTLIPPVRTILLTADHSRVFDTLEDYMHALVEARRASQWIGTTDADRSRAGVALTRLAEEISLILARLSAPIYRRCVLRHDDLHECNVLVDGKRISGIIDWEFHSTIPVALAAKPPSWIRYDGIFDPRFRSKEFETWWVASPEDASRLRAAYFETLKAMNEEYWRAAVDGQLLQQIEEWLSDCRLDPGCDRMSAWMNNVLLSVG
ncbi:hypothetical protein L226DRAFT_511093 [Lentinus tigrinus ALCF2SS1-7]|uniref:Aminoglycoside phosphotransferase domain-containing protein n=1 Tax=Lentinus tigrinus ALCF2SS1-6 TaxID=1328759 RepID=A0A5C2RMW2_9APHY|nr:hypothetical protein L227DRAFT_536601 [Lentinus tigrinus ALCF2SS1-6]RPD73201.1 hypothetical protein L226DRAFT_511093 [Lentinus tigrinus ALCF2SS1-7]